MIDTFIRHESCYLNWNSPLFTLSNTINFLLLIDLQLHDNITLNSEIDKKHLNTLLIIINN